jgi:hypothetical protein
LISIFLLVATTSRELIFCNLTDYLY